MQNNNEFTQLCVWHGCLVGSDKIKEFEDYLLSETGCNVKYECEVLTLPDETGDGGRNDVFFWIKDTDIPRFSIKRLVFQIRWWEDVLGNGGGHLYPSEHLIKYPNTWRNAEA